MAKKRRKGWAVGVQGYSYMRNGKRVTVDAYKRGKPKRTK